MYSQFPMNVICVLVKYSRLINKININLSNAFNAMD